LSEECNTNSSGHSLAKCEFGVYFVSPEAICRVDSASLGIGSMAEIRTYHCETLYAQLGSNFIYVLMPSLTCPFASSASGFIALIFDVL